MNAILRAEVKISKGNTKHSIGTIQNGRPVATEILPIPLYVCITEEEGGGFFLLHFNEAGLSFADTWHESLAAAKGQAQFEFEIGEGDWHKV